MPERLPRRERLVKSILYRLVSGWMYGFLTWVTRIVVYTFARWTVEGLSLIHIWVGALLRDPGRAASRVY